MATCNCVSIELLNSQLTQLGQALWISNYPCGGPSTVSQAWNAYPYDMFPAGPTIYICTSNLGSISYQYGIAGTPVIGIPLGAIQTVGGVCTSVNVGVTDVVGVGVNVGVNVGVTVGVTLGVGVGVTFIINPISQLCVSIILTTKSP